MALNGWLVDTSAFVRLPTAPERDQWDARIERGLVRVTTITRLELGFSSRAGTDARRASTSPPLALMPVEYATPAAEDRARAVQLLLADRGQHRAPSVPDLLVAAIAEIGGLTVLHVDKDFELIAEVTGQPVERLRVAPAR